MNSWKENDITSMMNASTSDFSGINDALVILDSHADRPRVEDIAPCSRSPRSRSRTRGN